MGTVNIYIKGLVSHKGGGPNKLWLVIDDCDTYKIMYQDSQSNIDCPDLFYLPILCVLLT